MKELLTAIRTRLRETLTYMRPDDIYITPDLDLIPVAAGRPCIGITDDVVTRRELVSDVIETTLAVRIAVYVRILKNEAAVIGDDATGAKGVLDIENDIDAALDEWAPSGTYTRGGWKGGPTAGSETVVDGTQAASRKLLKYEFEKEEER